MQDNDTATQENFSNDSLSINSQSDIDINQSSTTLDNEKAPQEILADTSQNNEQGLTNNKKLLAEINGDIPQTKNFHRTDIESNPHNNNEVHHNDDTSIPQENLEEIASSQEQKDLDSKPDKTKSLQQNSSLHDIYYNRDIAQGKDDLIEDVIEQKSKKKQKKKRHKPKRARHYKKQWNYLLYSRRLFIGIVMVACFVGLYGGYLLFGSTSLEALWRLNAAKEDMIQEVNNHKIENAQLQKKVLELMALEPKE